MATCVTDHYWKFFPQFVKSDNIFLTSGGQIPVIISIIFDASQMDVGSLMQTERNEKAVKGIQEKIMRARSTLDLSAWCCGYPRPVLSLEQILTFSLSIASSSIPPPAYHRTFLSQKNTFICLISLRTKLR